MKTRSQWFGVTVMMTAAAAVLAMSVGPEAVAKGSKGGHSAPRAAHAPAPHHSNPKPPAPKPPKAPRAAAPARSNKNTNNKNANAGNHNKNANANANTGNHNKNANANAGNHNKNAQAHASKPAAATTANRGAKSGKSTVKNPKSATHSVASSTGATHRRARGYGHGYRNRMVGRRSGYGRSQGQNRAIVSRLRSVHARLARVSHTYQGHRTKAMHSISMAIRQLSHRSMVYSGTGFTSSGRRTGPGTNASARTGMTTTQAQSDARMRQALRTTQGVGLQLANQGSYTAGHSRARGHVQRAIHEMNAALAVR